MDGRKEGRILREGDLDKAQRYAVYQRYVCCGQSGWSAKRVVRERGEVDLESVLFVSLFLPL